MPRSLPAVALVLAISGASALIWEVVWARLAAQALGSTAHGAALVTGLTLGGLGLGAVLAGRWADRVGAGLRGYAAAELGIGALGLALGFALPWWASQPALGGYVLGPEGWWVPSAGSWALRYGIAAILVVPPACLLGATVPLVLRATLGRPEHVGPVVGWLYGANLLGAAAGALSTDALWVPLLGLWGTQCVAAGGNVAAALGAWALAGWRGGSSASTAPRWAAAESTSRVAVVLFATGAAAMGLELLWFRFVASALGPYRASLSVVLGLVLIGMQVGSVLAGVFIRRWPRPAAILAGSQALLCVAVVAGLWAYDAERTVAWQLAGWSGRAVAVAVCGWVVLPGAVAMGVAFPAANALAQRGDGPGTVAGQLLLAMALGNVVGALGTGFVLLPHFGLRTTLGVLLAVAAAAAMPLWRRDRHGAFAGALGVAAVAAVIPWTWSADRLWLAGMPANRVDLADVLAVREGLEHTLVVTGDPAGPARLWTGGHPMTSTSTHAQRYMRLLAHLPLLLQDDPQRALVICFGVGNTLHAASLHPVDELVAVDLSADVLALAPHFAHANHRVQHDPRVQVVIEDGRRYLRSDGERFDLIALEPPPLAHAGTSALYARQLYEAAAPRLAPDGLVAQWLPAYQLPDHAVRAVIAAFVEVFPDATLHLGSGRELLLVGGLGARTVRRADIERRLLERPEVAADLARFHIAAPQLLASTLAGPRELAEVAAGVAPVTDDRPVLEYARSSHVTSTSLPLGLFAEVGPSRCTDCAPDREVWDLSRQVESLVTDPSFATFDNRRGDSTATLGPSAHSELDHGCATRPRDPEGAEARPARPPRPNCLPASRRAKGQLAGAQARQRSGPTTSRAGAPPGLGSCCCSRSTAGEPRGGRDAHPSAAAISSARRPASRPAATAPPPASARAQRPSRSASARVQRPSRSASVAFSALRG